jgi:hypothetical protein
MKIRFLVVASIFAVPVCAFQDRDTSDRCKPMDAMMGVHKAEPDKPDRSPKAPLLPKAQMESTGPAVLIPNCKDEGTKRRKKVDYPLA